MTLSQDEQLTLVEGNADLTRWNRAGLDRFNYVSHGAAEFAEALRIAHLLLYQRSRDPADLPAPELWRLALEDPENHADAVFPVAELRSTYARQHMDGNPPNMAKYADKLLAQYLSRSTDQSAQLSRAFARAMHVLSETLDAYANEGTLRTATQTEHALSLLSLIGFTPTPAASAMVPIAYQLKADQARQNIPAGTAFEYPLPEGGPNLTFEALDGCLAHPSLNAMLPVGYDSRLDAIDSQQRKFEVVEQSFFSHELLNMVGLIEQGAAVEAVRIVGTDSQSHSVDMARVNGQAIDANLQSARLHSAPKLDLQARPRINWIAFQTAPVTFPQAIVYAEYGNGSGDYYRVMEVRGRDVRLAALSTPIPGFVYEVVTWMDTGTSGVNFVSGSSDAPRLNIEGTSLRTSDVGYRFDESNRFGMNLFADAGPAPNEIVTLYSTESGAANAPGFEQVFTSGWFGLFGFGAPSVWLKPGESLGNLDTNLSAGAVYVEGASVNDFAAHERLVFELANGNVYAANFSVQRHDNNSVAIRAQNPVFDHRYVEAVYADFASQSMFVADKRSTRPLLENGTVDVLCPQAEQDMLRPGRQLLVGKDDLSTAVEAIITESVVLNDKAVRLSLDTGAANLDDYREGMSVIYGNVVTFGHGKSLPARVLGSGDASQEGQLMELDEADVSTRLNPGFPGGVAPDIQVTVDSRIWQQVNADADVDDGPHYSVIQKPDGTAMVQFHRLLTSGTDNVELSRIRTGAGADGNRIPANGVVDLQPKHSAVEGVVQPLAPQGGADRQGIEALRDRGKSRYALFDRALDVADFARLAESHTGVLHASAELVRQGLGRGGNVIRLYVVPAGGNELNAIAGQLEAMLGAASLPGTALDIRSFHPVIVSGHSQVHLLTGYADVHSIREELEALLLDQFGLMARPLGEPLFVAELSAAIESHEAVDYVMTSLDNAICSDAAVACATNVEGRVQVLRPDRHTSVYLDDFAAFNLNVVPSATGVA